MTENYCSNFHSGGRRTNPAIRACLIDIEAKQGLDIDHDRYELLLLAKKTGRGLGFTPALIRLLDYYMAFTRDCDWQQGARPIVYQSLSKTARDLGLSERQIQNLEKNLFEVGAMSWNDSGNHRRYGARDEQTGQLLYAYGVDLSPLAALRPALIEALERKQAYEQLWQQHKRQISWYRRQIRALIEEANARVGAADDLTDDITSYDAISYSIRAYMDVDRLQVLRNEHKALYRQLMTKLSATDLSVRFNSFSGFSSSTDAENFVHIKPTTNFQTNKLVQSNPSPDAGFQESVPQLSDSQSELGEGSRNGDTEVDPLKSSGLYHITFDHLKSAVTERFIEHLPLREEDWNFTSFIEAAYLLCPKLGINRSAWAEACSILGRSGAAICLLITDHAIDREDDPVRKPGGYFRAMVAKARVGELRLHASIFGILKRTSESDAS